MIGEEPRPPRRWARLVQRSDGGLLPYYWRDNAAEPLDRARRQILELRFSRVVLKAFGKDFPFDRLLVEARRYGLRPRVVIEARRRLSRRRP